MTPRPPRPNPTPPDRLHWQVSVFLRGVEQPLTLTSRTQPTLHFGDTDRDRLAFVEADWVTGQVGTTPAYVDWSEVVAVVSRPPRSSSPTPIPTHPIVPHWRVNVSLSGAHLALASRTEPTLHFTDGDRGRLAFVEADWTTGEMGITPPAYVDWSAALAVNWTSPSSPRQFPASSIEPHWRVNVSLSGAHLALSSRTEPTLRFADGAGGRLASVEADWITVPMRTTPAYVDWSAVVAVNWLPPQAPRSQDQLPPARAPDPSPPASARGGPPSVGVTALGREPRSILANATLGELADEIVRQRSALVERYPLTPPPQGISVGDITLDLVANKVFDGDEEVDLSHREFELLRVLMLNPEHIRTLGQLAEKARDRLGRAPVPSPPPGGRMSGVDDPDRCRRDRDLLRDVLEKIVAARDGHAMAAITRAIESGRQVLDAVRGERA